MSISFDINVSKICSIIQLCYRIGNWWFKSLYLWLNQSLIPIDIPALKHHLSIFSTQTFKINKMRLFFRTQLSASKRRGRGGGGLLNQYISKVANKSGEGIKPPDPAPSPAFIFYDWTNLSIESLYWSN